MQIAALLHRAARSPAAREGGPLAPKTVRNAHVVLRKALADAERLGLVSRNAAAAARPPTAEQRRVDDVVVGRPARLPRRHRRSPATRWASGCWPRPGMRRGEVLGLRWSDVDFDLGQLAVANTITAVGRGRDGRPRRPPRSRRNVYLDRRTRGRVARAPQAPARAAARCRPGVGRRVTTACSPTSSAARSSPTVDVVRVVRQLIEQLDVPRIRLHDLRHTHATLALKAGVHPEGCLRAPRSRHRRHHPRPLLPRRPVPRQGRRRADHERHLRGRLAGRSMKQARSRRGAALDDGNAVRGRLSGTVRCAM